MTFNPAVVAEHYRQRSNGDSKSIIKLLKENNRDATPEERQRNKEVIQLLRRVNW